MKIRNLLWDEWNEDHTAKHGINREEIEEVCFSRNIAIKSGKTKMAVWGQTGDGRYVLVILGIREFDDYYPISARDMDEKEKMSYRKWIKR